MSILEAIIIAIVEGITEFLPISSTGHMILTQNLLGVESTEFTKLFVVNIQFGAILSVLVLYWKRFFKSMRFYYSLFIAFIPAAVIGFLLSDLIDQMLERVDVVAISLLLGGVILLFVDKWFKNPDPDEKEMSNKSAFIVGLIQCIALIPGVSRSAATIIGGMSRKLSRKKAAEFSFFLAVPTMLAASAYKLVKSYDQVFFRSDRSLDTENLLLLGVGNLVAFVVAIFAMKGLIAFLTRYGFKAFGYYRIIVGAVILILLAFGVDLKIAG
jgi:undecaprenyl-diphosphatase